MEDFLDRSSQSKDAVQLRSQIMEKSQADGDLQLPLPAGQKRERGAGARATLPEQGDPVTWDCWIETLSHRLAFKPITLTSYCTLLQGLLGDLHGQVKSMKLRLKQKVRWAAPQLLLPA